MKKKEGNKMATKVGNNQCLLVLSITFLFMATLFLPFINLVASQDTKDNGGVESRASRNDWLGPFHDSQNTNYVDVDPPSSAKDLWKVKLGSEMNVTSPLIVDNEVYVGNPQDRTINSFDLKSGAERWKAYGGAVNGRSLVVGETFVYSPEENTIVAYYRTNGTKAWTITGFSIPAQPIITDVGLMVPGYPSSGLYDLNTGAKIHSYVIEYMEDTICAAYNNILYFNNWSVSALDMNTGSILWSSLEGGQISTREPVIVVGGHVILSGNGDLAALRRSDGVLEWKLDTNGPKNNHYDTGLSSDGSMLYLTGRINNVTGIHALDVSSGDVKWSTPTNIGLRSILNTVLMKDTLFVGFKNDTDSSKGSIWSLNAQTGMINWIANFPNDDLMKMAAAPNTLIVANKNIRAIGTSVLENNPPLVVLDKHVQPWVQQSGNIVITGNATDHDVQDGINRLELKVTRYKDVTTIISDQIINYSSVSKVPFSWVLDTTKLKNLDFQKDDDFYIANTIAYDTHGTSGFAQFNFSVNNSGVSPGIPTYTITYPTPDLTVGGVVNITGSAPDGWSVAITIDDGVRENVTWTSTKDEWKFQWDTTTYSNGKHMIKALPKEQPGALRPYHLAAVNVTVINPFPVLSLSLPRDNDGDYLVDVKKPVNFTPPVNPVFAPGTSSYYWDFGDSDTSQDAAPTHSYSKSGMYWVKLSMTNGTNSANLQIVVKVTEPRRPGGGVPSANLIGIGALAISIILIVGLVALANTEVGIYGMLPPLMGLYTRISKVEVLDHYTRGRIMGYLQANPGETYHSIKDELDLNNGTLSYHLKVMEREGFIRSSRDGIYKRFYPMTLKVPRPITLEEQILGTLRRNPGISQKEITNKVGNNPATVHRTLHRMEQAGIVRLSRDGRVTKCYLSEEPET